MLCECRETLGRAGKAFDGLEALLGGGRNGTFDLQVSPGCHEFRMSGNCKGHWAGGCRLLVPLKGSC